mmetsp:Transcript_2255/g.6553  ORF Transcript_2255/g.6553 Transcript_2255/m.6553 type:complete len:93 (-) Transcript_2255:215-493(-)
MRPNFPSSPRRAAQATRAALIDRLLTMDWVDGGGGVQDPDVFSEVVLAAVLRGDLELVDDLGLTPKQPLPAWHGVIGGRREELPEIRPQSAQ